MRSAPSSRGEEEMDKEWTTITDKQTVASHAGWQGREGKGSPAWTCLHQCRLCAHPLARIGPTKIVHGPQNASCPWNELSSDRDAPSLGGAAGQGLQGSFLLSPPRSWSMASSKSALSSASDTRSRFKLSTHSLMSIFQTAEKGSVRNRLHRRD